MSVLKYFKNIPRSPPIGRQALIVIFFLQIRNEVLGKKKGHVAPPPTGDRGLSPTPGATGACRPPQGRQEPVARWGGDRVPPPYISPGRHPLCHFSLKIQEKRDG